MAGFTCPRCHCVFPLDAEGVVTCDRCGQAVTLPPITTPLPGVPVAPRQHTTVSFPGDGGLYDRITVWVVGGVLGAFFLFFFVFAPLFGRK